MSIVRSLGSDEARGLEYNKITPDSASAMEQMISKALLYIGGIKQEMKIRR